MNINYTITPMLLLMGCSMVSTKSTAYAVDSNTKEYNCKNGDFTATLIQDLISNTWRYESVNNTGTFTPGKNTEIPYGLLSFDGTITGKPGNKKNINPKSAELRLSKSFFDSEDGSALTAILLRHFTNHSLTLNCGGIDNSNIDRYQIFHLYGPDERPYEKKNKRQIWIESTTPQISAYDKLLERKPDIEAHFFYSDYSLPRFELFNLKDEQGHSKSRIFFEWNDMKKCVQYFGEYCARGIFFITEDKFETRYLRLSKASHQIEIMDSKSKELTIYQYHPSCTSNLKKI